MRFYTGVLQYGIPREWRVIAKATVPRTRSVRVGRQERGATTAFKYLKNPDFQLCDFVTMSLNAFFLGVAVKYSKFRFAQLER